MNKVFKLLLPAVFLFLFACTKKENYTPTFGYEYFPLETGHWVIYDVDSTEYLAPGNINKSSYQIKELVAASFTDNEGEEAYRIQRYRRNNDSANWIITDIWAAKRTSEQAEKVEENLRFIKLVFPLNTGKTWKGNALINTEPGQNEIDYQDWTYQYLPFDTVIFNGLIFDSVLVVEQINDTIENFIEATYSREQYAKNVGLIEKETWYLTSQDFSTPYWFDKDIDRGFYLKMKIADYKK